MDLDKFMQTTGAEYYVVKEQYLAKKKEVEWKQREERLLFSEYVRLSKDFVSDNLQGCPRYYFDEFAELINKKYKDKKKLGKKESDTLEIYRSVFCEGFFPEFMRGTEIKDMHTYGWDCVGREFYFDLNGKEYGIYVPCPENITDRNFASFGGDVSEFEIILHEGTLHTVLVHTHELSKIKNFLVELGGKKKDK